MNIKQLLLVIAVIAYSSFSIAQDCGIYAVQNAQIDSADQVCLDVFVQAPVPLLASSGTLTFDPLVLAYNEIKDIHPVLAANNINFNDSLHVDNGFIPFSWFSILETVEATTAEKIFAICFTGIGSAGTSSEVAVNAALTPSEFTTENLTSLTGCSFPGELTITTNPINDNNPVIYAEINQIDCVDGNSGSILTEVFFGVPPYTWQWVGTNGFNSTDEDLLQLDPGHYDLTVTDTDGNTATGSYGLDNVPSDFDVSYVITDVSCFGEDNASIDITINTSGNYTFEWSNGANTEDAMNLGFGTHYLTITNDSGCQGVEIFEVGYNYLFLSAVEIIAPSCPGETDGAINLEPNPNANFPLDYVWSNSALTQNINNLAPGDYTVTIVDLLGCTGYYEFEVPESILPTATIDFMECSSLGLDNGRANIIMNPSANYTFEWSDNYTSTNAFRGELAPGVYDVSISNSNVCSPIVVQINIQEGLTAQVVDYYNCGVDTLALSYSTSSNIVGYQWFETQYYSDPTIANPLFFPPALSNDSTFFSNLKLTASGECTDNVQFRIHSLDNCVWPGDTNDDSAVNLIDFLFLGLANGQTGPERLPASSAWFAQPAIIWDNDIPGLNLNAMHADCDGNGSVEAIDTSVIFSNLNLTHYNLTSDDAENRVADFPLSIELSDNLLPDELYQFDLILGEETEQVEAIHGLTFQIKYDPALVDSDKTKLSEAGWLSATDEVWTFDIDNSQAGLLNIAMTKTNSQPAAGFGKIGTLTLQFKTFAEDQAVNLEIQNPFAINHLGENLGITGMASAATLIGTLSNTEEPSSWEQTLVFPNPAKDYIFIQSNQAIHEYKLFDLQGRLILSNLYESAKINIEGLPTGLYQLQLIGHSGTHNSQLVVH